MYVRVIKKKLGITTVDVPATPPYALTTAHLVIWSMIMQRGASQRKEKKKFFDNPVVEFINEKPVLKDNKKYFSISHSGDYIVLGFSEHDCGIDIEKIKPRDYKKISERMNFKSNSLKEFYLNWTEYEAKYKLGLKSQSAYSFEIPDYIITAVDGYKDEKYEVYYNI